MKILQICHRIPFPPVDGGNIAMMNMALALTEAGNEVHQFCLNTSRHPVDVNTIPQSIKAKLHFRKADIDTKVAGKGIIKNLFTNESYNVIRFYSENVEEEIERLLKETSFDIVQLETLFVTPYIPVISQNSNAKIILRAHNVEHIIWERLAEKEKKIGRKQYLKLLAARLKRYELETIKKVDAIIPITIVDEKMLRGFGFDKKMLTIPLSIEMKDYEKNNPAHSEMTLFHLGSMDWLPNVEGIKWFLSECWSSIQKEFPSLKLHLGGRNFPDEIREMKHINVICDGLIDDAVEYMSTKQIMIVPLHSGSGMRVKIIQGMALGKTIISTTVGAEGIPAVHEKNILIADTPDEFISTVRRCIKNPEWCREIGENSRRFVRDNYSNAVLGKKITDFYSRLLD